MRSTDDLIAALMADVRPVTPLAPWPVRLSTWCAVATLWVSIVVVTTGLRHDWGDGVVPAGVGLHVGLLLAAGFGAAAASLRRGVPSDGRAGDAVVLLPMAAWFIAAAWAASVGPASAGAVRANWACAAVWLAASALPGALLAAQLARAAPLDSMLTRGLVSVAGVALGTLAAELTCANADAGHLLLSHAAPAGIAIAGGAAGSAKLARFLERMFP